MLERILQDKWRERSEGSGQVGQRFMKNQRSDEDSMGYQP